MVISIFQPDLASFVDGCGIFSEVCRAEREFDPCFTLYTISCLCPWKYDPLGFSDGLEHVAAGPGPPYFDRGQRCMPGTKDPMQYVLKYVWYRSNS